MLLGTGVPPGDTWASQVFAEIYAVVMDRWIAATPQLAIPAWVEIDGKEVEFSDCGPTVYVDDAGRTVVHESFF